MKDFCTSIRGYKMKQKCLYSVIAAILVLFLLVSLSSSVPAAVPCKMNKQKNDSDEFDSLAQHKMYEFWDIIKFPYDAWNSIWKERPDRMLFVADIVSTDDFETIVMKQYNILNAENKIIGNVLIGTEKLDFQGGGIGEAEAVKLLETIKDIDGSDNVRIILDGISLMALVQGKNSSIRVYDKNGFFLDTGCTTFRAAAADYKNRLERNKTEQQKNCLELNYRGIDRIELFKEFLRIKSQLSSGDQAPLLYDR